MKKLISVLLSATLLITSLCMTSLGASAPEVDEEMYQKVISVLEDIEIIKDAPSLAPQGFVTYSEFLGYLSNLTNSSQINYTAFGTKANMANEVVEYNDAVKIVVDLLGWSLHAKNKGYSTLANTLGLTDGLLNEDEKFARYDAMMLIYNALGADYLVQTAYGDKNVYSTKEDTIIGTYKGLYEFSGKLLATKWNSVYNIEGLGKEEVKIEADDGSVTDYRYYGTDSMNLLGTEVIGYYKLVNGIPEVVSIQNDAECIILDAKNYPSCNISTRELEYEDSKGNLKKLDIPMNVTIVLNGRSYPDINVFNDKTLGNLDEIKIYEVDGKYKTIHISISNSYVAEILETDGSVIGFVNGDAAQFEVNDFGKNVFFYNENGDEISVFDVEIGDVLSFYKSVKNGSVTPIIKVVVSNNTFIAKVTTLSDLSGEQIAYLSKVSTDENGKSIYSAEEEYTLAYGYENSLKLDTTYKFYVDRFNRILYSEFVPSDDGRLSGLYIKVVKEDRYPDNGYKIFMMPDLDSQTQPGAQILEISPKAEIEYENDKGYREDISVQKAEQSGKLDYINKKLMHSVVYYYTNSDGQISQIVASSTTPKDGYLYSFNPEWVPLRTAGISNDMILATSRNASSVNWGAVPAFNIEKPSTYFGGRTLNFGQVSNRMIMLPDIDDPALVDADYADKYYTMISPAKYGIVSASLILKFNAFSHDGELVPDYGMVRCDIDNYKVTDSLNLLDGNRVFLVDTVTWVRNEDNQKVMKIKGLLNGVSVTLYTSGDKIIDAGNSEVGKKSYITDITEGDVLLINRDTKGYIYEGIMICDYNPDTKKVTLNTVTIPGISNKMFRSYIDDTTGVLNDEIGMVEGKYSLGKVLGSKVSTYIAYPYRITKSPYNNTILGASFIVDPSRIEGEYPSTKINQVSLNAMPTNIMYYDTEARGTEKRTGKATALNMVSYFDDPYNMSKVFLFANSLQIRCAIIYR